VRKVTKGNFGVDLNKPATEIQSSSFTYFAALNAVTKQSASLILITFEILHRCLIGL